MIPNLAVSPLIGQDFNLEFHQVKRDLFSGEDLEKLGFYKEMLKTYFSVKTLNWDNIHAKDIPDLDYLTFNKKVNLKSLFDIIDGLFSENSFSKTMQDKFSQVLDNIMFDRQSPILWQIFFESCFDKLMGVTDSYLKNIVMAEKEMKKHFFCDEYRVLDLSYGTGNWSSYFGLQGHHVTPVGKDALISEIIKEKLDFFQVENCSRPITCDVLTDDLIQHLKRSDQYHAVLLNNVLCSFPEETSTENKLKGLQKTKKDFLAQVYDLLSPGGIIILNEPLNMSQSCSLKELKRNLTNLILNAYKVNPNFTELELAVFVYVYKTYVGIERNHFSPLEQVIKTAEGIGFVPKGPFYENDLTGQLLFMQKY